MGDFKTVFKKLRKSRNMTQGELAEAIGITRSRLSMYELGKREPDFETLEAIADYFNVDIDYLMGRTDKTTISGFVREKDDFYTIVLNARMTHERNQETYRHEQQHIDCGDLDRECSADQIELEAHRRQHENPQTPIRKL